MWICCWTTELFGSCSCWEKQLSTKIIETFELIKPPEKTHHHDIQVVWNCFNWTDDNDDDWWSLSDERKKSLIHRLKLYRKNRRYFCMFCPFFFASSSLASRFHLAHFFNIHIPFPFSSYQSKTYTDFSVELRSVAPNMANWQKKKKLSSNEKKCEVRLISKSPLRAPPTDHA